MLSNAVSGSMSRVYTFVTSLEGGQHMFYLSVHIAVSESKSGPSSSAGAS